MMPNLRQIAFTAALLLLPLTEAFTTTPLAFSTVKSAAVMRQRMAPLRDAEEALEGAVEAVQSAATTAAAAVVVAQPTDYANDGIPPLSSVAPDLATIALVAGQENYGLAIVCVGEALWSFTQAPSFDHAKVLVPAGVAALVLGFVSGPMITSGDPASVSTGLFIATGVSLGLGASYVARMLASYSPSSKEIAAFGLLVAVAGFFSFSQNLIVDGFVTLPSIPLPSLPEISLPF